MSYATRLIVDRIHVGKSDTYVVREIARRVRKQPKALRKQLYREALKVHHENQTLYHRVMTGRF